VSKTNGSEHARTMFIVDLPRDEKFSWA
jgi:hypothetical protein